MKRRLFALIMMAVLFVGVLSTTSTVSSAKTVKKIKNGGYYCAEYKKAGIKSKTLTVKGLVVNWERSTDTPEYSKSATFKFKLAKNCEIIDGYKADEKTISKSKFNKLCKKKDADHQGIAFTVKKNKVTMIRFW